jgi:DivIVA domain-containing protein
MNIPLLLVIAVTVGAVVFGVMTLVTGGDPGLRPVEPDSRARPLPGDRPLLEDDVAKATFDMAWRGYRMDQVDQTLRRLAYDIGYKTELIQVLEAEIAALRDGRLEDAAVLAQARAASLNGSRSEEPAELSPIDLAAELRPELLAPQEDEPAAGPVAGEDTADTESLSAAGASVSRLEPEIAAEIAPETEPEIAPETQPEDAADTDGADIDVPARPAPARAPRKSGGGKARKTGVA